MFENVYLKKATNDYMAAENAMTIVDEVIRDGVLDEGPESLEGLCNIIRGLAHQSIKDAYALYCLITLFRWDWRFNGIILNIPFDDELIESMRREKVKRGFRKCLKGGKIKIKFQTGDITEIYKF